MDHRSSTFMQVLATTEQLAAELGCQNTTLQEIIRRSGISKGAIYHYVQSKDELFGLILQNHMEKKVVDYESRMKASAHSAAHPHVSIPLYATAAGAGGSRLLGPIPVIVKGLLQPVNEKQIVLRRCLIYLLSRQEQPDVAKILSGLHQKWIDFTAAWITACQSQGMIPLHISPVKSAAMIISILFGLMVQKSITENNTVPADSTVEPDSIISLFTGILGLQAAAD